MYHVNAFQPNVSSTWISLHVLDQFKFTLFIFYLLYFFVTRLCGHLKSCIFYQQNISINGDTRVFKLKGEEAKTRPPETLSNADFKIRYIKQNSFFNNIRLFLKYKY